MQKLEEVLGMLNRHSIFADEGPEPLSPLGIVFIFVSIKPKRILTKKKKFKRVLRTA